jgi:hypothetical protein
MAGLQFRLWSNLGRWALRRTRLGDAGFSYTKRSSTVPMLVMLLLVTPVEVLFLELLLPWAWLRWTLLGLAVYAVLWTLAFHASLVTLPHRLEEGGLRLRYGAFAEGLVPYAEIAEIKRRRSQAPRPGDGLQAAPEEDALYLAMGGKTDLTLRLRTPKVIEGLLRTSEPATTIHLAADEPEKMTSKLRQRVGEPAFDLRR